MNTAGFATYPGGCNWDAVREILTHKFGLRYLLARRPAFRRKLVSRMLERVEAGQRVLLDDFGEGQWRYIFQVQECRLRGLP